MAKNKIKENTTFTSGKKPMSAILNSTFINRINSIFGFRTINDRKNVENEFEKKYGIKFVRVDLNNPSYRIHNAALGSVFQSVGMNEKLEKLFDAYLSETTETYDNIMDRQKRLNELTFACCNNVYISRACTLVADEATQQDEQDRIISIDSPNATFVEKTYQLLNQWGITQNCIHSACFDIQLYGEAFWTHKIGLSGIERINYLHPNQVMERLEFSPAHVATYLAQRDGWNSTDKNRGSKIEELVKILKGSESLDEASNLADMFDSKLLGFELNGNILCPPWMITHFRFDNGHGEFYPYGRPPLIWALAPFKQFASTMALQGLARLHSFPIQVYNVKNTEGILPAQAFDLVNTVREQYDNLGVAPSTQGAEKYTVNTKCWVPEGLLKVESIKSECEIPSTDDIEGMRDDIAVACGIPRGYLDPSADYSGESGISLKEQYKPFARHVYTVQTTFLQGLGELIRMHYAITGEFDYNTPFILSMSFPAQEVPDSKRSSQSSSIDLAKGVVELIQTVLGIDEDEALPEDVIVDILSKYTFLNPTDIQKWVRLSSFAVKSSDEEEGAGTGDEDLGGDPDLEESRKEMALYKKTGRLTKMREQRFKDIRERYREAKENIYFKFLESQHLEGKDWKDKVSDRTGEFTKHRLFVPPIREQDKIYPSFQVLSNHANNQNAGGYDRLKEQLALNNSLKLNNVKDTVDRHLSDALESFRKQYEITDENGTPLWQRTDLQKLGEGTLE